MSNYRVLIVDDQRDLRYMLRNGLETLDPDIKVIDVPSGEEAILVTTRQPIDLLVADVRLPGISGLELKARAQIRHPNMKVILITGLPEPKVRREVANAGADAFFYKPIELPEFLEAVRICLGIKKPVAPEPATAEEINSQPQGLAERLASLRQELEAVSVTLMDDRGQVMAQAGEFLNTEIEPGLVPSLIAVFRAAENFSNIIGATPPRDLLHFAGRAYHFFLMHVGQIMGLLLVVSNTAWSDERMEKLLYSTRKAVQDLQAILVNIGVPVEIPVETRVVVEAPEPVKAEEASAEEVLPDLDAIFGQASKQKLKSEEVDAFWDSMATDIPDEMTRADVISYDQARQLGLAPDE
jgi:CheY-like chemotaxis protein